MCMFVMCGCVYVWICNVCVYVWVLYSVGLCMCGFYSVCVCVGFVMCGCVYVWVL